MNEQRRRIWCAACDDHVNARLTYGKEIYPSRRDLASLPFWKCDACGNHVGCHHKTDDRTRPLGVIAGPELRQARVHLHAIIDPLWKNDTGKSVTASRRMVYREIERRLGMPVRSFHVADIKTVDAARRVYKVVQGIMADRVLKELE